MLVGLALATFIAPGPLLWVYVVLGAAVSVVATLGTANALKPFGVAALTFPVRHRHLDPAARDLRLLRPRRRGAADGRRDDAVRAAAGESAGLGDFVKGVLLSISQVFLKGSGIAALLLLAGLAVSSVPAALSRSAARSSRS